MSLLGQLVKIPWFYRCDMELKFQTQHDRIGTKMKIEHIPSKVFNGN